MKKVAPRHSVVSRLEADQLLHCMPFLAPKEMCRHFEVQLKAYLALPPEKRAVIRKKYHSVIDRLIDQVFTLQEGRATEELLKRYNYEIIGLYLSGMIDLHEKLVELGESYSEIQYPSYYSQESIRNLIKMRLHEYCS